MSDLTSRLPGPGRLPMAPGVIKVTDLEKQQLEALGWKSGDAIPGNLAEAVARLTEETAAAVATQLPVAPDTPPIVINPVDISTLSADKRAELAAAMAQAKLDAERLAAIPQYEGVNSSVNEAIRASFVEGAADMPPVDASPGVGLASATDSHPANCPHCGWNLALTDETNPTSSDKYDFLQALLGGKRFSRTYNLMGDAIQIAFRTLTPAESDMVDNQLFFDISDNKVRSENDYHYARVQYRLPAGLQSIRYGGVTRSFVTIDQSNAFDPPKEQQAVATRLVAARAFIESDVLRSESLRRIVGKQFMRFQRLVEALEAQVDNPDFWEGIGSVA